jgi:hypothetical protein
MASGHVNGANRGLAMLNGQTAEIWRLKAVGGGLEKRDRFGQRNPKMID